MEVLDYPVKSLRYVAKPNQVAEATCWLPRFNSTISARISLLPQGLASSHSA
jgi:hypothetical protein